MCERKGYFCLQEAMVLLSFLVVNYEFTIHLPLIEEETQYVPSKGWAEMLKKIYEVNPLLFPQCRAAMKIITFIDDFWKCWR